jgi:YcxB-like protein
VNPGATSMLEFQCRADEYVEARLAAARVRRTEYWLNRIWGPTLLALGLVVVARDGLDPSGYLVAAVGVALVLNGTVWLRRRARVEWRMIPRLGYRTRLGCGTTGLRLTTVDGDVDVAWSAILHVVETDHTFALSRSLHDVYVIPKRAFETEARLDGFRARLAAECPRVRVMAGRPTALPLVAVVGAGVLMAVAGHAGEVPLRELLDHPSNFDGRSVALQGRLGRLQTHVTRKGNRYYTFELAQQGRDVLVAIQDRPSCGAGVVVRVKGRFDAPKKRVDATAVTCD